MRDLVAFGEVMLRLSPPPPRRLEQSISLDVFPGGSELNTAVAAQRLGLSATYVSCLPRNPLGRMIENRCREHGVDTSRMVWRENGRVGLYFVEYGAAPRPAEVSYDRAGSAFTTLQPGEIPWPEVLAGARVFLTSGINPPLAPQMTAVVREALQAARAAGCAVAFDLNYRSKLWLPLEAAEVLQPLLRGVDILFATDEDARLVLGVERDDPTEAAREISRRFGIRTVNYIYAPPPGSQHLWEVVAVSGGQVAASRIRHRVQTVDRVGAGDAYSAGFLLGYLRQDLQAAVELGNALLALKNTVLGDFALVSLEEVQAAADGQGGTIKR